MFFCFQKLNYISLFIIYNALCILHNINSEYNLTFCTINFAYVFIIFKIFNTVQSE